MSFPIIAVAAPLAVVLVVLLLRARPDASLPPPPHAPGHVPLLFRFMPGVVSGRFIFDLCWGGGAQGPVNGAVTPLVVLYDTFFKRLFLLEPKMRGMFEDNMIRQSKFLVGLVNIMVRLAALADKERNGTDRNGSTVPVFFNALGTPRESVPVTTPNLVFRSNASLCVLVAVSLFVGSQVKMEDMLKQGLCPVYSFADRSVAMGARPEHFEVIAAVLPIALEVRAVAAKSTVAVQ